jgi:predicted RNase H-like nuclease (RuvC/YqgF family)
MSGKQDNTLWVIGGIILGGLVVYLFNRNNQLNQRVTDLENNSIYQSQYLQHLLNKIAMLENENTNLNSKYQEALNEINILKQQIPDYETRQFLVNLIQKVKERKSQRIKELEFNN